MSSELSILVLYGLLVLLTILIQVLTAAGQVGLPYLSSPRDEGRVLTGVAGRAERCLTNSVVALALFAPAVLVLQHQAQEGGGATLYGISSLLAAQAFLVARVLYIPVYLAGIPWLRTLIWLVGFAATAWLYLLAL